MLASKQFKRLHFEKTKKIVSKQKRFYKTATQIANRKLETWHKRKMCKDPNIAVILQVNTSRAMNEIQIFTLGS